MRRLYLLATALFWLLVAGFWLASLWLPTAGVPVAAVAEQRISQTELAQHAESGDCWMAIRGSVYDVSAYLPDHPSRPEMVLPWCGKEATEVYNTKTKGRPHSHNADELLVKYRIGTLIPAKQ
jgi:cytochrome b involved in lipid metabolism